jgi:hypothetical protein
VGAALGALQWGAFHCMVELCLLVEVAVEVFQGWSEEGLGQECIDYEVVYCDGVVGVGLRLVSCGGEFGGWLACKRRFKHIFQNLKLNK